jgi:hypothetical protein
LSTAGERTVAATIWFTTDGEPSDQPVVGALDGRFETPTRLWLLLVTAVTAVLTVGLVTGFSLAGRESTVTTAQSTEALYVEVQDLAYSLADANATAATALLVGPVMPSQFSSRYNSDVTKAEDLLASTSQHVAADPYALGELKQVAEQIPVYTGLIGQALADNRLGPSGATAADSSLNQASNLMTGSLLTETTDVSMQEQASTMQGFGWASSFPLWALLFALVGFVVLRGVGRRVARLSRRRVNPGLFGTTLAVLGLVGWSLFAFGGAGIESSSSSNDFTGISEAQSEVSQLSLAEAYVALQQLDRGTDGGTYAKQAKGALTGADPILTEVSSSSADAVSAASQTFTTLSDCALNAIDLASRGLYQQATTATVGSGAKVGEGGCEPDASALHAELTEIYAQSQTHFDADTTSFAGQYAGSGALPVALGIAVLGVAAAVYGINRRLAEYR